MPTSRLEQWKSNLIQWTSPSNDRELFVILDELYEFARAFGLAGDVEFTGKYYRQVLGHLAPDMLQAAVRITIAGWKWAQLPKPADIANNVPDAWQERRDVLGRIERELERREREGPADTSGPVINAAQLSALRAKIAGTRTMPGVPRRRGPPPLTVDERERLKPDYEKMREKREEIANAPGAGN